MGSGQSFGYPIQRLDSVSRGGGTTGVCTEKKCGGEQERISSDTHLPSPPLLGGGTLLPGSAQHNWLQYPDITNGEHKD